MMERGDTRRTGSRQNEKWHSTFSTRSEIVQRILKLQVTVSALEGKDAEIGVA